MLWGSTLSLRANCIFRNSTAGCCAARGIHSAAALTRNPQLVQQGGRGRERRQKREQVGESTGKGFPLHFYTCWQKQGPAVWERTSENFRCGGQGAESRRGSTQPGLVPQYRHSSFNDRVPFLPLGGCEWVGKRGA